MANNPLVDAEDFEAEDPATCPEYARLLARYDMPLTDAAVLGRGSMSVVRRAVRREDQLPVAVKQLPKQLANEALREVASMAELDSPDILRLFDLFVCAKNVFIVTELAQGGDLLSFIRERERLSEQDTREIARRLLRGVQYLHAHGIAHRDLKPENIMFSENGLAKLVDLGIAKALDDESLHTRTSASFGTPAYVAPEQALEASKVDSRADVYSLGVILFEMLCGRRPYAGDTPMAIISQVISDEPVPDVKRVNPDVPNWASALVMRMCAKNPDKRISSAEELLRVIDVYLHKERESADFSPVPERSPLRTASGREVDEEVEREIADMERRKAASRRNALLVKIAVAAAVLTAVLLTTVMALLR